MVPNTVALQNETTATAVAEKSKSFLDLCELLHQQIPEQSHCQHDSIAPCWVAQERQLAKTLRRIWEYSFYLKLTNAWLFFLENQQVTLQINWDEKENNCPDTKTLNVFPMWLQGKFLPA